MIPRKPATPFRDLIRHITETDDERRWPLWSAAPGLWTRVAYEEVVWPPGLHSCPMPKPPPLPKLPWWQRLWQALLGWLLRNNRKSEMRDRQKSSAVLAECYGWLALHNFKWLAPWFAPMWPDTPTALCAVTEQGILWALLVTHLRTWGPKGFEDCLTNLPRIPPSAEVSLGDCVALHVLLEDLFSDLPKALGVTVPATTKRRTGGLRFPKTLRSLPEIRLRSGEWWNALKTLVERSPITQIVYADIFNSAEGLLEPALGVASKPPTDAPPMRPVSGATDPASADHEQGKTRPASSGKAIELWISHLSRSLLAAYLSPPASDEERESAVVALEAARTVARGRLRSASLIVLESEIAQDPAVRMAQESLRTAEAECRDQHWNRLVLLTTISRDSLFFRLRFLDMLVRRIAADCGKSMLSAWKTLRQDEYPEPRNFFFFGENAVCRHYLSKMLWGTADAGPAANQKSRLIAAWKNLRPESLEPQDISNGTVIPKSAAEDLVRRYMYDVVHLPALTYTRGAAQLALRNAHGYPPHDIWSQWSVEIVSWISSSGGR